jgi:23S rRNA (adenine2503-C2)-methyltransferase
MEPRSPTAPERPVSLYDLTRPELESLLVSWGAPRYAGKQVFQWMYKKRIHAFDAMTDQPAEFRELLEHKALLPRLRLADRRDSADGTSK